MRFFSAGFYFHEFILLTKDSENKTLVKMIIYAVSVI
jgi:hypothetical protein